MYTKFALVVAGVLVVFSIIAGFIVFFGAEQKEQVRDVSITDVSDVPTTDVVSDTVRDVVPRPSYQTQGCSWEWFQIRDVGIWAEKCTFNGVPWYLKKNSNDGLVLMIGNREERRALQLFQKPNTRPIESIVNQIKEDAPAECVMQKNDIQSGPGRLVYEFVPTGALKRSFEKSTTVPPDPCGSYGISAAGQRLFEIWEGHEDVVIFLDYGPDGSLFEYETLTFIR